MPIYNYQCSQCKKIEEIEHSMNECDNPSEEIILKTSCNQFTCFKSPHENTTYGASWKRVIGSVTLLNYGTGTYDKGGLKSRENRLKFYQERSKESGKKEGVEEQKHERTKEIKKQFGI